MKNITVKESANSINSILYYSRTFGVGDIPKDCIPKEQHLDYIVQTLSI